MANVERVKWAREVFKKKFPKLTAGITSDPDGNGYILSTRVQTQEEANKLPEDIEGVRIMCKIWER